MLEINVINKLPDNKVLIAETETSVNKKQPRYYIADEDKADKFIKGRKNLRTADTFQKNASIWLGTSLGVLTGICLKSNKFIKIAAGLATGVGTAIMSIKLDKLIDRQAQKNYMRHYKVDEITQDKEKVEAALNYAEEPAIADELEEPENSESDE